MKNIRIIAFIVVLMLGLTVIVPQFSFLLAGSGDCGQDGGGVVAAVVAAVSRRCVF